MAWSDWFLKSGSATADEQDANYRRQKQLLAEQQARKAAEGTLTEDDRRAADFYASDELLDQDAAAWEGFLEGAGEGAKRTGNLAKDLVIVVVIGAGVWLFFKFGGVGWIKKQTGKSKWVLPAVIGAGALIAWLFYSRLKQTGEDASDFFKSLNPFA